MRQIRYKFNNSGRYITGDDTVFGSDDALTLTVEPHDFSIAIGSEVLRESSCGGYEIEVFRDGETAFYDAAHALLARTDKGTGSYRQVKLVWKQDILTLQFGRVATVDYYPNCDGEHDRWGKEWETQRAVTLNLQDNSLTVE